jgi:hypothetical protein
MHQFISTKKITITPNTIDMKKNKWMSVIAFLLMTLPVMSQPNDMELADPKPGPQEAWNALKKITLGWGTIDQR